MEYEVMISFIINQRGEKLLGYVGASKTKPKVKKDKTAKKKGTKRGIFLYFIYFI